MAHKNLTSENLIPFVFGGKSFFEITSHKTGEIVEYKVFKDDTKDVFYVSKKIAGSYTFIGVITEKSNKRAFKCAKRTANNADVYALILEGHEWFNWFVKLCVANNPARILEQATVNHLGKCATCGRKLKDQESIDRGFGPVCFSRLQQPVKAQEPTVGTTGRTKYQIAAYHLTNTQTGYGITYIGAKRNGIAMFDKVGSTMNVHELNMEMLNSDTHKSFSLDDRRQMVEQYLQENLDVVLHG